MKHLGRSVTLTIVVVVISACSQSQPSTDQAAANATPTPTPRPLSKDREEDRSVPIEDARVVDVWPTVDGAAYAVSESGQIWYVKGRQAVRVREVDSLTTRSAPAPNTKAFAFALLARERQRNRQWLNENREMQEKLYEVESELSKLKESRYE